MVTTETLCSVRARRSGATPLTTLFGFSRVALSLHPTRWVGGYSSYSSVTHDPMRASGAVRFKFVSPGAGGVAPRVRPHARPVRARRTRTRLAHADAPARAPARSRLGRPHAPAFVRRPVLAPGPGSFPGTPRGAWPAPQRSPLRTPGTRVTRTRAPRARRRPRLCCCEPAPWRRARSSRRAPPCPSNVPGNSPGISGCPAGAV